MNLFIAAQRVISGNYDTQPPNHTARRTARLGVDSNRARGSMFGGLRQGIRKFNEFCRHVENPPRTTCLKCRGVYIRQMARPTLAGWGGGGGLELRQSPL